MAVTTGSNTIAFSFYQALSYGVGQSQSVPIPLAFRSVFNNSGDLLDQCDLIHCKRYTFAASTPQVIDLKTVLDIFGSTAAFARLKLLAIRVNSSVDGQVLLLGANGASDFTGLTAAAATATVIVYPSTGINDGFAIFQAPNSTGMLVGSSTHLVKADPGSNAFTVDILAAGNVA